MILVALTAVVGRAPGGDWTYHLATPTRWVL